MMGPAGRVAITPPLPRWGPGPSHRSRAKGNHEVDSSSGYLVAIALSAVVMLVAFVVAALALV
jgi:hypothetical protein